VTGLMTLITRRGRLLITRQERVPATRREHDPLAPCSATPAWSPPPTPPILMSAIRREAR